MLLLLGENAVEAADKEAEAAATGGRAANADGGGLAALLAPLGLRLAGSVLAAVHLRRRGCLHPTEALLPLGTTGLVDNLMLDAQALQETQYPALQQRPSQFSTVNSSAPHADRFETAVALLQGGRPTVPNSAAALLESGPQPPAATERVVSEQKSCPADTPPPKPPVCVPAALAMACIRGVALDVSRPSVTVVGTGAFALPPFAPVCSLSALMEGGRVAVLGSAAALSDGWLEAEANASLSDALFRWCMGASAARDVPAAAPASEAPRGGDFETHQCTLAKVDTLLSALVQPAAIDEAAAKRGARSSTGSSAAKRPPPRPLPCDTEEGLRMLWPCLDLAEPLPRADDVEGLFALAASPGILGVGVGAGACAPGTYGRRISGWASLMYAPDPHRAVPEALAAYAALGVPHEPLSLIPPSFEAPLPLLVPAAFAPSMPEPPPPALELFDLDAAWAPPRERLAQIAAVCAAAEAAALGSGEAADAVEDFVREAGAAVGTTATLPPARAGPRHVIEALLRTLTFYRLDDPALPPLPLPLPAPASVAAASGGSGTATSRVSTGGARDCGGRSATGSDALGGGSGDSRAQHGSSGGNRAQRMTSAYFAAAGWRGSGAGLAPAAAMAASAASLSKAAQAADAATAVATGPQLESEVPPSAH